ncbi:MAG: hypothetical protein GC134_00515 [Proteobacteria bacterium]|nr:hypothetical protein [Pseudomonadota bacterium]
MALDIWILFLSLCAATASFMLAAVWAGIQKRKAAPAYGTLHLKIRQNGAFSPAPASLFDVLYNGSGHWVITVHPYPGATYGIPRRIHVTPTGMALALKPRPQDGSTHTGFDTDSARIGADWRLTYAQGSTLVEAVLVADDHQPDVLELWFDRGWAHFVRVPLS